jgi:hypothetical protein
MAKGAVMRMSHRAVLVTIPLVWIWSASAAWAAFASTDCILPSVGRGAGKQGSEWFTRIWAHNPGSADASIRITFLVRDRSNTAPAVVEDTVPAGAVNLYNDPITELFETTGFGALRFESDLPLVVHARIFSQPPEGPAYSVGQLFAAVPTAFAVGIGEKTTILGGWQTFPEETSYYRFNYGLVETAGGSATIEVRVFNYKGGERTSETITVQPFEVRQWNLARLLPGENAWAVYLDLEVIDGDGRIVAFGSLIANESNDPSTFEMQFADRLLDTGQPESRP